MDLAWFGQFSASVATGAVAAFLATRLALGRFYKERWWEKKLATYTAVVEAIHHIKRDVSEGINERVIGYTTPEAEKKELKAKHDAAASELSRARDMGELLMSRRAIDVLVKLEADLEMAAHAPSSDEFLQMAFSAVDQGLADFKAAALIDLKLKSSLPWARRR